VPDWRVIGDPMFEVPSLSCTVPIAAAGLTAAGSGSVGPPRTRDETGGTPRALLGAPPPGARAGAEGGAPGPPPAPAPNTPPRAANPAVGVRAPGGSTWGGSAAPCATVTGDPRFEPPSSNWPVPAESKGDIVAANVSAVPPAVGDDGETERVVDVPISVTTC